MNRLMIGVSASALSALLCSAGYLEAQISPNREPAQIINGTSGSIHVSGNYYSYVDPSGRSYYVNSSGVIVADAPQRPSLPQGSAYHQVVDIYYDGDGNKLDSKSYTHRIDYDCNRNLRRQDEQLMVQDDGKGNVRFVQSRLPSEPMTGVKPVSPEGMIKAALAAKRSPHVDPVLSASTSQFAAAE